MRGNAGIGSRRQVENEVGKKRENRGIKLQNIIFNIKYQYDNEIE
jgi:hypothetical protein